MTNKNALPCSMLSRIGRSIFAIALILLSVVGLMGNNPSVASAMIDESNKSNKENEVSDLSFPEISSNSVTITWNSDVDDDFFVAYGTDDDFSLPEDGEPAVRVAGSDEQGKISYKASLTGLEEATKYYFRIYRLDDDGNYKIYDPGFEYLRYFATESETIDTTKRINYWWGKVNQYNDNGTWKTDPDGVSGANIHKLSYCRKWYPDTVSVRDYRYETINDWRNRGNVGSYSGTFESIECVQGNGDIIIDDDNPDDSSVIGNDDKSDDGGNIIIDDDKPNDSSVIDDDDSSDNKDDDSSNDPSDDNDDIIIDDDKPNDSSVINHDDDKSGDDMDDDSSDDKDDIIIDDDNPDDSSVIGDDDKSGDDMDDDKTGDGDIIIDDDKPNDSSVIIDNKDLEIKALKARIKKLKLRISQLEREVVMAAKKAVKSINKALTERLKGKLLLQVEGNGEVWYVDSVTGQRFYLENGERAYNALQAFGLGITNADLSGIPIGIEDRAKGTDSDDDGVPDKLEEAIGTDPLDSDSDDDGFSDGVEIKGDFNPLGKGKMKLNKGLAERLDGRILIQVEDKGQSWYVKDGRRYYMKDGEQAYQIMRFLSLGIKNEDLNKIGVGDLE